MLLLPSIVPVELTDPLSFKIGPVSALEESFKIAETSDESRFTFLSDVFVSVVRSVYLVLCEKE